MPNRQRFAEIVGFFIYGYVLVADSILTWWNRPGNIKCRWLGHRFDDTDGPDDEDFEVMCVRKGCGHKGIELRRYP